MFDFYMGTREAVDAWNKADRGLLLCSYAFLNNNRKDRKYLHHTDIKSCDVLICDESHSCKNYSAGRTRFALEISKRADFRYILTGTPTGGNNIDYYCQMRILSPEIFDNMTLTQFRHAFFLPSFNRSPQGDFDPECQEVFDERIQSASSSLRLADVREYLPKVQENTVLLPATDQMALSTQRLKSDYMLEFQGREISAVSAQAALMKFNQIANGHCLDDNGNPVVFTENPKLQWLADNLPQITEQDKVIIWCIFKQDWRNVTNTLSTLRIPFVHYRSGMSTTERGRKLDLFRNKESNRVIVAHQDSAGTGVNLSVAPVTIVYSRNYNWLSFAQALSRNVTIDSKQVTIYNLVTHGTVDSIIKKILDKKGERVQRDMSKFVLQELLDL